MTIRDVMRSPQTSPDGVHWEPSLPYPHPSMWRRLRDAWEVFCGRAHAVRQTTLDDVPLWEREETTVTNW